MSELIFKIFSDVDFKTTWQISSSLIWHKNQYKLFKKVICTFVKSFFGLYGKCTISTIGTIGTISTIEHFWAQLIILEINFFWYTLILKHNRLESFTSTIEGTIEFILGLTLSTIGGTIKFKSGLILSTIDSTIKLY